MKTINQRGGLSGFTHPVCALALGALLAAAALLSGGGVANAQTEIVIGGTIAKSGRLQGIVKPFPKLGEAWAKRINAQGGIYLRKLGRSLPVRFILYDDQSKPSTALKFYERLATVDKVDIFIGPFSSFITNAALQATATHKIPFFMVEANDPVMFQKPNRWRTTGLDRPTNEYKRIAELFKKKGGVKTFALLAWDNLHDRQAMEGFGAWLRKFGFQVVYQDIAPKGTTDYSSIILAMKRTNPDVVFAEFIAAPVTIGFLKAARAQGLNPKEFIVGHMPIPVIKAMGKEWSENIMSAAYVFEGSTRDHLEEQEICRDAGFECWQFPESGIRYNVFRRIQDALERAGSLDKEAIRKAMWETNLVTFGGELVTKVDNDGYGTLNPWPTQIQNGKPVTLWPLSKGVKIHRSRR